MFLNNLAKTRKTLQLIADLARFKFATFKKYTSDYSYS
jgi:hypothetical protein